MTVVFWGWGTTFFKKTYSCTLLNWFPRTAFIRNLCMFDSLQERVHSREEELEQISAAQDPWQ